MKPLLRTTFSTSMIVVLAGCGTPPPNPLMGSGHTPDYEAGFNDGCASGRAAQDAVAGYFYTKDAKRFDTDKQYAAGWSAGYSKCSYSQMEEDAFGGRR